MRYARIGQARALPELELFERRHSPQNLQAAIRYERLASVIGPQPRQAREVLRGRIPGLPAIHTPQTFEVRAKADVAEPRVRYVHGHQFAENGEARQYG